MRAFSLIMLAMAVLLVGCSDQSGNSQEPVETTQVDMPPSYRFDPTLIQIQAGTTVTWHNSDNFTHSVSVLDEDLPFLNLKPGESGSITFSQPGDYEYVCTYHAQNMTGKVIVTAP